MYICKFLFKNVPFLVFLRVVRFINEYNKESHVQTNDYDEFFLMMIVTKCAEIHLKSRFEQFRAKTFKELIKVQFSYYNFPNHNRIIL